MTRHGLVGRLLRLELCSIVSVLLLVTALCAAAHDLDLVRRNDRLTAIHLEGDVLDEESPDLVAEAIGVKRSLYVARRQMPATVSEPFSFVTVS